ncbi:MAG TPA: hypothetical protein VNM37_23860, partial [Candidatus Dormibacteraeota bacterium]|nr:hypothetical protein [Candidatus Dormibacteraeota bacterium]
MPDSRYGGGRCGLVCNLAAALDGTESEATGLGVAGETCPATAAATGLDIETEAVAATARTLS